MIINNRLLHHYKKSYHTIMLNCQCPQYYRHAYSRRGFAHALLLLQTCGAIAFSSKVVSQECHIKGQQLTVRVLKMQIFAQGQELHSIDVDDEITVKGIKSLIEEVVVGVVEKRLLYD